MSLRLPRALGLLLAVATAAALPLRAEHLPVRVYSEREGLAGDHVRAIVEDARGFLWFATNSGVSSFDGDRFVNFGVADGLPLAAVRELVLGGDGRLYALSNTTVVRTAAPPGSGAPLFEPLPVTDAATIAGDVLALARAPDGAIVLAAERGVFRFAEDARGARLEALGIGPAPGPAGDATRQTVEALTFDTHGALWAGRPWGITRRTAAGEVTTWPLLPGRAPIYPGWGWYPKFVTDALGRVWLLSAGDGLWAIDTAAPPGGPVVTAVFGPATGLPSLKPRALEARADGTLWVGTSADGLARCTLAGGALRCNVYGRRHGLPDDEAFALHTDAHGNLWCGTFVGGLARIAADGMVSWGEDDGLRPASIVAIADDPAGGVLLQMGLHFAQVDGARVTSWPVQTVTPHAGNAWGAQQTFVRTRDGRLWLATGDGLYVYAPGTCARDLERRAPERVLTHRDGLSGDDIYRLFVDRVGDVWIGTVNVTEGLCRYRGADSTLRCFGPADGIPATAASAFAEDGAGHLWVGFYGGGLYRFRDGRFETWPEVDPDHGVTANTLVRDDAGSLWVSGRHGALQILDAAAGRPRFEPLGASTALSRMPVNSLAFDTLGRIYLGGVHGVERVDPRTGARRTFTVADGLPSNRVGTLHRDRAGALWIGTSRGVARLVPGDDRAPAPPRVYVTGVRVAGVSRGPWPGRLDLASDQANLDFTYTAPSFRAGERLLFRTRLVGASDAWSPPTDNRTVSLTNLAPGDYRFEVQAMGGDGVASTAPAAVAFTIAPPFWRRPAFVVLAGAALCAGAFFFYRARVSQAVALERVRTHIATDLHDDIGSSLSHIAILGQLARRRAQDGDADLVDALDRITGTSGELVDALSDVVWAVNPVHDRLADLVHRMRRFASELFAESGVALELDLVEARDDERIDADVRRQVYLVFKEALHNVLRHADARHVTVRLARGGGGLSLTVKDDGRGIAEPRPAGHGLSSMTARAAAIGARLEIDSRPGSGTTIVMTRTP